MDPKAAFFFALERYADQVEMTEIRPPQSGQPGNLVDSSRVNEKRPATITLTVPDELVKNVRGLRAVRDMFVLVRIPHEVLQRSESRIILPGEDSKLR